MFELLRALLFGQVVTLSPATVALGQEPVAFTATEPIKALNAGARLSINVSSVVLVAESMDTMRRIEEAFPQGCIRASGLQANGTETQLGSQAIAWSPAGAYVVLAQAGGASTKVTFTSIKVSSCRPVPRASAEWANYGK
jgi:hypothetical protein